MLSQSTGPVNDRLLEAATRPLAANTEHQLTATHLLAQRILPDEAAAASAITRWASLDAKPRFRHWHIVFFTLLIALSAAVIPSSARKSVFFVNLLRSDTYLSGAGLLEISTNETSSLTPSQKLLLHSGSLKRFGTEHAQKLWDTQPLNPAYFSLYAQAHFSEFKRLPPDFLETAHRLDPENAWFIYLAASVEAGDSVKKQTQIRKNKAQIIIPKWDVLDPAKFEKALTLLRSARDLPRCECYLATLTREVVSASPRRTHLESIATFLRVVNFPVSAKIKIQVLAHAIAAKAWLTSQTQNTTEFIELLRDSDALLEKLNLSEVSGPIHELVTRAAAKTVHQNLTPAAESLGLTTEFSKLKETNDHLIKEDHDRKARREFDSDSLFRNSGFLETTGALSLEKFIADPLPLTDADVRPSRYRDYEHFSSICTILAWLLLICTTIGIWSYRFRAPEMTRHLSSRLASLLQLRDHAWILLCGIILPFLTIAAISRFTPLGGRELGLQTTKFYLPSVHFLQLLLLWITFTTLATRWRIRKRIGAFQLISQDRWLTAASVCGLAAVPIFGWAAITESQVWALAMAAALAAAPAIWIAVTATRSLLSHSDYFLPRQILSRSTLPAFMAATLIFLTLIPLFEMRQQHWFEQDTLFTPNPAFPGLTPYEYKIAAQMRKELRETLHPTEP